MTEMFGNGGTGMEKKEYIRSQFAPQDDVLEGVLKSIKKQNMPMISVSPESGKLMTLLIQISGAKEVLEVGALGGYSGIHLVRGLPEKGQLTSLELKPEFAKLAHSNLKAAGFGDRVTYYTGPALESFEKLDAAGKTFDLFFIDADKENYDHYLEQAIRLSNPGGLILADNTLWSGKVYDFTVNDANTVALRKFNEKVANHPKLDSILIPIGDGITLARVKS
jgi:caffeoyl-CoA O-methyltransferase